MMVMVDNTLYQSTGEVSTIDGRCGNMDGEITSQTANGTDAPTENGQSNFGTGYGYQRIDDHIEVLIDTSGSCSSLSPTRMYKTFVRSPYFI